MFKIQVTNGKLLESSADVLVVPVAEDLRMLDFLGPKTREEVKKLAKVRGFKAGWGEAVLFPCVAGVKQAVALIGTGKDGDVNRRKEGLRRGVGSVLLQMRQSGWRSLGISVHNFSSQEAVELAGAMVEGATLADYRYTETSKRLKEKHAVQSLKSLDIYAVEESVASVKKSVLRAQNIMRGVELARDLVNRPADRMNPEQLVKVARELAKNNKEISLKVYDRKQAEKAGFRAFLAVAQGSETQPYVIHYKYKPKKSGGKKVVLIGKGVTFDSGGLSLKPGNAMETMKLDMAGAAAVLGVLAILPVLKPNVEVHGMIAACENMPSGKAYRPGDVLTAKNGTTIEVVNTDAEGRLTLADMLTYAAEQKPTAVIDLATLTGACMVALGETVAGLVGNNEDLAKGIMAACERSGERVAELPLPDEYRAMLDSNVADIKNLSSSSWGGAITAGIFLREFVGDADWAHIDIAGPSYAESARIPYWQNGATGYGVRLLAEYLSFI